MTMFLLNILLAVLWTLLWGSFDMWTLLGGFALGYVLLGVYSRVTQIEGYGTKVWDLLRFGIYFLGTLIKANLLIAYDVLTPRHRQSPRIIRYNVEGLTEVQITTFSTIVTLTPGTLVLDISDDRRHLYIHCMYAEDRDAAVEDLDRLRQRMLTEVF